jgi:hypothetical protein
MKLYDLAGLIFQGTSIERSELITSPNNFIYLLPESIKNNFITEEGAKYINEKSAKKISRAETIAYGDIIVYLKPDNDFGFFRFTQEINKTIIPSPHFTIIKSPTSFLINILQHESSKRYLKKEIQEIWKHKDGNWKKVASELKNIDIPAIFEDAEISISPGNIPVDKNDFAKISIRKGIISNDNLIKKKKSRK